MGQIAFMQVRLNHKSVAWRIRVSGTDKLIILLCHNKD